MEPKQRLLILKKVSLPKVQSWPTERSLSFKKTYNWPFDFNNQVMIEF